MRPAIVSLIVTLAAASADSLFACAGDSYPTGVQAITVEPESLACDRYNIQRALDLVPANGTVYLDNTSYAEFHLNGAIFIRKSGQTLRSYWGLREKAHIILPAYQHRQPPPNVDGLTWPDIDFYTAITSDQPGIRIQYLWIDGGYPSSCVPLYHVSRGYALISVGGPGASGITISDNWLQAPAGWSALCIKDGSTNVLVDNNWVVNAGFNYQSGGIGFWADGISMFGSGTLVGNHIKNATDGSIVIFRPNVTVQSNVIEVTRGKTFGGINLVDNSFYGNTVVDGNVIEADSGGNIDVAVAVGVPIWSCSLGPTVAFSNGSRLTNNTIQTNGSGRIAYGIVLNNVSGLAQFSGNVAYGDVGGYHGGGCDGTPAPLAQFAYAYGTCQGVDLTHQAGLIPLGPELRHVLGALSGQYPPCGF